MFRTYFFIAVWIFFGIALFIVVLVIHQKEEPVLKTQSAFYLNKNSFFNEHFSNLSVSINITGNVLDEFSYLNYPKLNIKQNLNQITNLKRLLLLSVVYHEYLEPLFVSNNSYLRAEVLEYPEDRIISYPDYCFTHTMLALLPMEAHIQKNLAFDYTFSNETINFLIKKYEKNFWPQNYVKREKNQKNNSSLFYPIYSLSPLINILWTSTYLHTQHRVGLNLACPFQMVNHIPENKWIFLKSLLVLAHRKYEKNNKNFQPFIPKSYLLNQKEDCVEIFSIINSANYIDAYPIKGPTYILKISSGVHRGRGVNVLDRTIESQIKSKYGNGSYCGSVQDFYEYMIQEYITNPMTLYGHKYDFRAFLLIFSSNPLVAYYHDGFLRVSLYPYDAHSNEKGAHITATEISKAIFKDLENNKTNIFNKSVEELKEFQIWSYERLDKYMEDEKGELNWVNTKLRPNLMGVFQDLVSIAEEYFEKHPSFFEIFGVDFIIDENNKLWIFECNSNPELVPTNLYKELFFQNLLSNAFELVFSVLNKRIKKIVEFLLEVEDELKSISNISTEEEIRYYISKSKDTLKNKKFHNYLKEEVLKYPDNSFNFTKIVAKSHLNNVDNVSVVADDIITIDKSVSSENLNNLNNDNVVYTEL